MARPSDREFTLKRKLRELEDLCRDKDVQIEVLKKKIDKLEKGSEDYKPKKRVVEPEGCPDCGATLMNSELPFGRLILCSKACGYKEVKRGK